MDDEQTRRDDPELDQPTCPASVARAVHRGLWGSILLLAVCMSVFETTRLTPPGMRLVVVELAVIGSWFLLGGMIALAFRWLMRLPREWNESYVNTAIIFLGLG